MKKTFLRFIAIALLAVMICSAVAGCGKKDENVIQTPSDKTEKPTDGEITVPGDDENKITDPNHPANRRPTYADFVPLSRAAAAEGIVMLTNEDNVLPLVPEDEVVLVGNAVINLVDGASGSANVNNSETVNLLKGMLQKQREEKVIINDALVAAYADDPGHAPTVEELTEARKSANKAVFTITRNAKDGEDRTDKPGDYYLSAEEMNAIKNLVDAGFEDIIVVVNSGNIIDTTKLLSYPEVKAILFAWLPGQYGGAAISDILVGDITPSGKLTDTLARSYRDYPTADTFGEDRAFVNYTEDIFVGYRYFETFDPAGRNVNFCFGHGLSYTTFAYSDPDFEFTDDEIIVTFTVTNTGEYLGKETAQLYFSAPQGELGKPAKELCAFAKTRTLYPGESQELTMTVDIFELASYDDTGKIKKSAYIIEEGDYEFFLGSSIQDAQTSGLGYIHTVYETEIVEELSEQLPARLLKKRLLATGEYEEIYREYEIEALEPVSDWTPVEEPENFILFSDLYDNPELMAPFLAQLSPEQLIYIVYAHTAKIEGGEGSTGEVADFGIPITNTADGTAGLRLSKSCMEYPVAASLACTWNEKLLSNIGEELAFEAKENNAHYWLAPAVNIHRDPLGGANFEYFSEDPYLSGMLASAIINGVQKNGVGCAIKHLVGNEKEDNRKNSDSRMSERALREIYLRPFQIAVEEADPWMMMTSYNLVNGVRTSVSRSLIVDIVRGEWGYEGVICTDRKNSTTLIDELIAGSDLKLPTGDRAATLKAYEEGKLTRAVLEEHAARVVELLLKTGISKNSKDIRISADKESTFKSVDFVSKSSSITVEDCKDEGGTQNTGYNEKGKYLTYNIVVDRTMTFEVTVRVASPSGAGGFDFYVDDEQVGSFLNRTNTGDWQSWKKSNETATITLPRGKHVLKLVINEDGLNFNTVTFTPAVDNNAG